MTAQSVPGPEFRDQSPGGDDSPGSIVSRLAGRPALGQRGPSKIPWEDPAFSERMLREHLSQAHDRASRREAIVDVHVDWIFAELLGGQPADVLDLGCGPGLYTARLAERGCTCLGVDISPASISYAERIAAERALTCSYRLGDVRTVDLDAGHDLAMMVFGELNTFSRTDAADLLRRVGQSLRPGGTLVLEVHTHDFVVAEGTSPAGWYTSHRGVYSDRPHLVVYEQAWDATSAVTWNRSFVLDDTGRMDEYGEALMAYTEQQYHQLLQDAGYSDIDFAPGMGAHLDEALLVVTARNRAADGQRRARSA